MTDQPPSDRPTVVFQSGDPGTIAVAESLLEDAGIEYFVRDEEVSGFYPGRTSVFIPAIVVRAEDADVARELLGGLEPSPPLKP